MSAAASLSDAHWMTLALTQARAAGEAAEVPVGAVVVKNGQVIAAGANAPLGQCDPSAHAEINAMRAAARVLGNYRLEGCELFVTLEPCAMCAGAMLHARLARVVFGAADPKTGAAGSVFNLFALAPLNHQTRVTGGVLAEEGAALLQHFFRVRRDAVRLAARPLRDDALRTSEAHFTDLSDCPWPSRYVSSLLHLDGWGLHYLDIGAVDAPHVFLCLHGAGQWGYAYRHLIVALQADARVRVLVPDLIGFGKSDKPKREDVHALDWHAQVLCEWLAWLDVPRVRIITGPANDPLASLAQSIAQKRPAAVQGIHRVALESNPLSLRAQQAPFPDRGHEAALRVFGKALAGSEVPASEAIALLALLD